MESNKRIVEEELKLVKAVILHFLQVLKICQLYEADHPIQYHIDIGKYFI